MIGAGERDAQADVSRTEARTPGGSVVDEPALLAALKAGTIRGAGLDVYRNEPNPDPELAAHFAGRPLVTPV